MVSFILIVILALLVVFISFKVNNASTTLLWRISLIGIAFLLLMGYIILSGKEVNLTTGGVSDAAKTYFSWLGAAGSNIARITSYAFNQEWKADRETNNTGTS